jgi:hypothetical protein
MGMDRPTFDDRLELVGILAGAYILFTVVGMLVGQPWSTAQSSVVAAIQIVGILATAAIAVFLVLVARGENLDELAAKAKQ